MEEKNNKGLIWLIIILIVLVLGLIGFIVYDKAFVKDINNNTTKTTTTAKKTIKETDEDIKFNDLVKLLKDYYINQEAQDGISDFYDDNNVENWNIYSIKYLGYYEDEEFVKYYVATGDFKCKDNGYSCIYMEQVDYETTYSIPFKAVFAIKQTENKYKLDHMESLAFDYFVIGDEETSEDFVLINKELKNND